MTRTAAPPRAVAGCLLGHAVADALGLPREGLSPRRARRLFGDHPLEHRLVVGRGMVSDDTEHHTMVAQALLASGGDVDRFTRSLAWRLRWWLLALPAGIGYATLRALVKLWLGVAPARAGVDSAGNGAAMRAPILGVCLGGDPERLREFVAASTRLTHRDPRAEQGALIVATASWLAATTPLTDDTLASRVMTASIELAEADDLRHGLVAAATALVLDESPRELAAALGLQRGVTGFVVHTVPMALFCWLRYRHDYRRAVEAVVELGGDTDTTGAIVGALAGAQLGVDAIPDAWQTRLVDWPRSRRWILGLADAVASVDLPTQTRASRAPRVFWPAVLIRNVFFFVVVFVHGLRRLLPPY